ncbi:hypothetical protein PFICI_02836 [Pestalotiopsis fici W106-1]|uniref:Cupin type-1 domain-containing protein n=1 Tax=Pestalotiopsis fici (strain W106-1 / CGMCC3.15140) TaxID=1229662 RepID=W3XHW2_PESFW|nr:uncharacterized protein PFICI_02836 [Pestalotiopsis fici W106-1]ETS84811.1 hypothetical protein PFICI_02836 [Pestalotiopsis fici W106-1]
MSVNQVPPETIPVPATPHSPNSKLPVVVYRGALLDKTLEGALQAVDTSEWPKGGHWKIAQENLAATPHYHSITHEAYTVLHGHGTYSLGKSPLDAEVDSDGNNVGVTLTVREGDVFAFPSGVTHCVTDVSPDYEIIGFYSLNERNSTEEPYDMEYALDSPEVTCKKREICELVPTPVHDPIYGKTGPLPELWRRT